MNNEAFEKWAIDYGLDYESSFTRDDVEASWQAAKANSESILQEQQNTIAELKAEIAHLKADHLSHSNIYEQYCQLSEKKITELQAHINDLREALNSAYKELLSVIDSINKDKIHHDGDDFHETLNKCEKALPKTPAQSLQEHDNATIEKCAKVCESSDRHRGEYFATKIRALKETI